MSLPNSATLGGQLEVGGGTEADGSQSRPADYLVPNWSTGKPAAFDITVTSPLNPISFEAKVMVVLQLGWPRCANTSPTTPSAGPWGGFAFHWLSRPMGAGDETYGCWG